MTIFKVSTLSARLALTAAVAIFAQQAMAVNTVIVDVADDQIATASAGNVVVANGDILQKTGDGALLMSGDHTGAGKVQGQIEVIGGVLQYNLANTIDVELQNSTKLDVLAAAVLAGSINLTHNVAGSFTIDCNSNAVTLPAISAVCAGPAAATLTLANTGGTTTFDDLTLGAYTKSHTSDDKMIVAPWLNVIAPAADNLAQNLDMQSGSKLSITADMILPKISVVD